MSTADVRIRFVCAIGKSSCEECGWECPPEKGAKTMATKTTRTYQAHGVRLELTADPATPNMVYLGKASGTYDCVTDTGEIWTDSLPIKLTDAQLAFLDSHRDECDANYDKYRDHSF